MRIYLLALVLSLGSGALYACLSLGLVITYRSSRVVNFAYGAMAMYGAYVYSQLRATGGYLIPPLPNPLVLVEWALGGLGIDFEAPTLPTFLDLGGPMAAPPAVVLTLVTGAVMGLLLHFLVFRPMRNQPALGRLVATVGLMVVLQSVITIRFGTTPNYPPALLPTSDVHVMGVDVPIDRFILAGIAIAIAVVCAYVYQRTRLGWITEAVAENPRGAVLSGLPTDLVAGVNLVIGSTVAVLMGMLLAPITGLTPTNFTYYILPALAAMLLARTSSFLIAAAGGFAVAGLQSVLLPLQASHLWLPVGLADAVPLVLILVAMLFFGKVLPTREDMTPDALPAAPIPRVTGPTVTTLVLLTIAGCLWLPFDLRGALFNSLVAIPLAVSLVVIIGLVAQVSLMQLTLAGIAAVAMTRLAGYWGIPYPIAPILAALVAAAFGVIAALPALRLRGTHLAIVTLATALAVSSLVFNNPDILFAQPVPAPELFGIDFGIGADFFIGRDGVPNPGFGLLALVASAFALWLLFNIRRSIVGRTFLAVRSNERASASMGINVASTKVLAFAISSFLAGITGAYMAYQFNGASPSSYNSLASLGLVATAYLAGISRWSGAVVAGILAIGGLATQVVLNATEGVVAYYSLISGIGLVFAMTRHPEGIAGDAHRLLPALRRLRQSAPNARSTHPIGSEVS